MENPLSIQEHKIRGGLSFPLDYEDRSAIKSSAITSYNVQLVNGSRIIYDNNVSPSSTAVVSHQIWAGDSIGLLRAVCGNGQITIESTSTQDNSIVSVIVQY